jgi:uncharacterized protein with von Willebrand factor type A (vWA) domain
MSQADSGAAVPSLLFAAAEAPLAPLERLARGLWLGGLTHSQGHLEPRLAGLEGAREALLAGRVPGPAEWPWGAGRLTAGLGDLFASLGLAGYCQGREALTDMVLQSLLFHLDFIVDFQDRGASEAAATAMALEALGADWKDRQGMVDELTEIFGELGDLPKHTRWDLLQGLLRSAGWQEVVRIRRLLERLPELCRVIRRLGRARQGEEWDPAGRVPEVVLERATALREKRRTVRVPELPGDTRGVTRSGRIARMLPAEAMLLAHPRLRLVWHARHAERALLTYEDDDRMSEVIHEEAPTLRPSLQPRPERRFELGPILVCVDTSGSMQGGAEAVAKATVLEAVRSAHAQGRACHLIAFGGEDEMLEMELGVDPEGVARLAAFLAQGFRGGTDICSPIARCVELLEANPWRQADLLLASDGEFGATQELADRLSRAKADRGLRVQGVLIGDRETIGLLELADEVFWVRDWRHFGTSDAASPVHSKSLTALYFPGALRNTENRQGTVSGEIASAAVRAGQHTPPRREPTGD